VKYVLYAALVLLVVPFQVILGDRISIAGVHPDLALITVCLIGLQVGETEAVATGGALGFMLDLFSGGAHWGNLFLKPVVGLLAGRARRSLVNFTPKFALLLLFGLSIVSGLVMFLLKSLTGAGADFFAAARGIILPQACFDAALGFAFFKLIQRWTPDRPPLAAISYE
jgi:rod shape-determining protein MreD